MTGQWPRSRDVRSPALEVGNYPFLLLAEVGESARFRGNVICYGLTLLFAMAFTRVRTPSSGILTEICGFYCGFIVCSKHFVDQRLEPSVPVSLRWAFILEEA